MAAVESEGSALIGRLAAGDRSALAEILAVMYPDLRELARARLRHVGQNSTLQPTALVHETCVRLLRARDVSFENRAHLLAVAATAMRQVLVDHARRHRAQRRGAGTMVLSLDGLRDDDAPSAAERPTSGLDDADVLVISEALERLESLDARKGRVVELRFFGGLSLEEAAAALGVSRSTVANDWRFARSWLVNEVKRSSTA